MVSYRELVLSSVQSRVWTGITKYSATPPLQLKVTKLKMPHTPYTPPIQGEQKGQRKVRKPQWNGSPVTHISLHFHLSPQGTDLGIQVRACQQYVCVTASCALSARGACVCDFVLFLYFMKHFTPQWGSKCTVASAWCFHCDRGTWDVDTLSSAHTHTHTYFLMQWSLECHNNGKIHCTANII